MLKKMRDPISAVTHLTSAAAALVGLLVLMQAYNLAGAASQPFAGVALIVYGVSLFMMFLASGIYHSVEASPAVIQALRKVDHSAIYLLIAGSYTPFCVIAFHGFWQWGFLTLIWSLAAVGIVSKLFFIHAPRWFTAGVYVVMGWLSVFAAREMQVVLPSNALLWLVIGGLIYTAGAGVYVTKKLDFIPGLLGFHEVWHVFVMGGAAAHFVAVMALLNSPL